MFHLCQINNWHNILVRFVIFIRMQRYILKCAILSTYGQLNHITVQKQAGIKLLHLVYHNYKYNSASGMWLIFNFSPLFATFSHFSPLLGTFHHFSPLFTTFHHFSPLFTTFPHFKPLFLIFCPLFRTFNYFLPFFPNYHHFSPTFSHFPPLFYHFSPLFATFSHLAT